jgi:DNA repair protein RecN (Recombination protein N)
VLLTVQAALAEQLAVLESHDARAAELSVAREQALAAWRAEQARVTAARRAVAPQLAEATEAVLARLAMPRVHLSIAVGAAAGADVAGDANLADRSEESDTAGDVTFLLAANPGAPLLPLSRVASGGELARTMLALRLALDAHPHVDEEREGAAERQRAATLIFDEVDAGIGGEAATAVGEALAQLATDRQVLVVTHLAQVAAWSDAQVAVTKRQDDDTTVSVARRLEGEDRVVELARMLSGSPDSETARRHAAELLTVASRARAGRARAVRAGAGQGESQGESGGRGAPARRRRPAPIDR